MPFNRISFVSALALTLIALPSGAAPQSHFEVKCEFPLSAAGSGEKCLAEFRLCGSGDQGEPPCEDIGAVGCESSQAPWRFEGTFARSQQGNLILLKGKSDTSSETPLVTLGPAKTPPKPGRPVIADSRLESGTLDARGECAVRMVR